MPATDPRIVVALDFPAAEPALALARRLDARRCRLKVGKELFTAAGPAVVDGLQRLGFQVFLDLKFHDIPNTVAGACRAAAAMGVWMVNVHALGGRAMMSAAREALAATPILLVAVTVLTSLREADLREVGVEADPAAEVERLAALARDCGLHGVVCSAQEATRMKARLGADFLAVTPGIRPAQAADDDQARVLTPAAAVAAGADYLVIGRPITAAADPLAALAAIEEQLQKTGART